MPDGDKAAQRRDPKSSGQISSRQEPTSLDTEHRIPVGRVVRRLRKEKALSLMQLSALSGVSVGMLSQVERDLSNPSMRILSSILSALDAPMSVLFEPAARCTSGDPDFVQRAHDRPMLELGHLNKELLSSRSAQNLQLMILHIKENGSSGEYPLVYPGEKAGLVLKGHVFLRVGFEEARLSPGDSFAFGPQVPHSFRHAGGESAEVLWVIGPVSLDRQL